MKVTYNGKPCELKRASVSGFWNIWPLNTPQFGARRAVEVMLTSYHVARMFPQHAGAINDVPDSSD